MRTSISLIWKARHAARLAIGPLTPQQAQLSPPPRAYPMPGAIYPFLHSAFWRLDVVDPAEPEKALSDMTVGTAITRASQVSQAVETAIPATGTSKVRSSKSLVYLLRRNEMGQRGVGAPFKAGRLRTLYDKVVMLKSQPPLLLCTTPA
jgi:hypothetical protein